MFEDFYYIPDYSEECTWIEYMIKCHEEEIIEEMYKRHLEEIA